MSLRSMPFPIATTSLRASNTAGASGRRPEPQEKKKEDHVAASFPESHPAAVVSTRSSISNIELALDGSTLSKMALPVMRALVEIYRATPHLIYAGEETIDPKGRLARLGLNWEQTPGAVIHQAEGSAPDAILALARDLPQPLIVMCTHTGHNKHGPGYFGSITEAVLSQGPERIVLVAPEHDSRQFKISTIVLAHDGTPAADCAVAPSAELAIRTRAAVIAVHVAAPHSGCPEQAGSFPAPQYIDQPQHEWPSWSSEFIARMLALGAPAPSVKFELVVAGGQPGPELAHFIRRRNADIVVMGIHGQWRPGVSNAARVVIQTGGCPVLLVRSEKKFLAKLHT
jgi:nucleotide-binding universal stress UspA family protein